MTNCVCPVAGFCERHKVEKSEALHSLCQTRDNYFQAWEAGRGPRQNRPAGTTTIRPPGPGTELARLLAKRGYRIQKECGCKSKIGHMNVWGTDGCRQRIDEISAWLIAAAKTSGWYTRLLVSTPGINSFVTSKINDLILEAIVIAETKASTATGELQNDS